MPILERALIHLWRRHLADAATRALLDRDDSGDVCALGFVDLVGFTACCQQLDDRELAELVTAFEALATTTAARHGGTVVKTMGDEVMFVHDAPASAARIALEMVERCDDDPALPTARGGLAWGNPLVIGGDYFGPPVNLASRIVKLALPDTVLADPSFAERLHGVDDLTTKPLQAQRVRVSGTSPPRNPPNRCPHADRCLTRSSSDRTRTIRPRPTRPQQLHVAPRTRTRRKTKLLPDEARQDRLLSLRRHHRPVTHRRACHHGQSSWN